jgi:hypothetical protein
VISIQLTMSWRWSARIAMLVRGLVDRDSTARLVLTSDGRAVLNALLGD